MRWHAGLSSKDGRWAINPAYETLFGPKAVVAAKPSAWRYGKWLFAILQAALAVLGGITNVGIHYHTKQKFRNVRE